MAKKTPADFEVKPLKVVEGKDGEAELVQVSMAAEEAVGITIDNLGRSSLAEVAAHFYNLGHQHSAVNE